MSEHPPHVQQALNELDNAEALGSTEAAAGARKRLEAAGLTERQIAAARRAAAASDDSGDEATTPKGRTTAKSKQVTTDAAAGGE